MAIDIEPLTPDRLPDLATLFEQGGDPKWCWCASFRVRGSDWTNAAADQNRAVLEAATHDAATQGRAPGLIAYDGDEAIGWVSVGPRDDYGQLADSKVRAAIDDTPVWSIVCFVVGRRSRGQGVATALLAAAIDYAREHGATMLEAYPVEIPEGARVSSASVYRGTLSMFERAGFEVVERRQVSATGPVRPIVRLAV